MQLRRSSGARLVDRIIQSASGPISAIPIEIKSYKQDAKKAVDAGMILEKSHLPIAAR